MINITNIKGITEGEVKVNSPSMKGGIHMRKIKMLVKIFIPVILSSKIVLDNLILLSSNIDNLYH